MFILLTRLRILSRLATFVALVQIASAEPVLPDRPNFLVILMDDLRADALHSTGHSFAQLPNIDRIGGEGITFTNAFVTTPLCLPSRASFLTGQYAHTHGVQFRGNQNNLEISRSMVTFPALLQKAGYASGYFGKWHIGNDDDPRPGFDRWVSFREQGEYENPKLNIDGSQTQAKGYLTDLLTDHVIEFMRQSRDRPFIAYLAHKAVHAPFIPARRHERLFAEHPIQRAPSSRDNLAGKPMLQRPGVTLSEHDPDVHSSDELIRNQIRCLQAVDESTGRLFGALEKTGQLDRTVLIFTSDHGYFWGEHDLGGKHGPYEEALRIPLLIRYPPRIRAETRSKELVLNIDVAPTCLDLAGVQPPATMQGASMTSILSGNEKKGREAFLAEYAYNPGQTPHFLTWQAVRTHRYKLIHYPDFAGGDELYDLEADPYEMTNLVKNDESKQVVEEMRGQLQQLLKETQYLP